MVSSERTPNESYAQRVKKATASSTPQPAHQKPPSNALSASSSSSLKPPQVNVWAERIREQKAAAIPPPAHMPRQRAASSPQSPQDGPIQPRSSPPALSTQLAILDRQDEHDPFVVRVPPHLSRQSSSGTNPLPLPDPSSWPNLPSADPPSSATHDSPFVSATLSRQNSTASFRHHAHSSSGGSVRLSRVQSSFSQHSHSASQSRVHSRSGSSASSPRLQIRGRKLPQDDSLPPDHGLDHHLPRSSNKRSSPALPDPPTHISSPFQIDSPPPADPPYFPPPVPPLQDMSVRYSHSFIPQYALPPQFPPTHVPGHNSPSYIPHSGQGTPPYPHYPPYPAYMYGHPSLFWGDAPLPSHIQNHPLIPPNNPNASEHPVLHKMDFGSISPPIAAESGASKDSTQGQNSWQPKPSKSVVFGTIDLPESLDDSYAPPLSEGMPADAVVVHVAEQFATFSIGVPPDEPVPLRLASRKPSVRSLSKTIVSQLATSDVAKDASNAPLPVQGNGIKKPIRWEFGTTLSEDIDDPQPPSSPPPTSQPLSNHRSKPSPGVIIEQPAPVSVPSSYDISRPNHPTAKSDTGSSASDVWVVKDYGYGFGNHSGGRNAPDALRWEMHEREKERTQEDYREREMIRDQYRDRGWAPSRQPSWQHENGTDEGREGWEQQAQIETQRHVRPRRGSFPGYGVHERGGVSARRGRGFGGRYHGGRGRGGFFHHQRPGSYPYAPPPPLPPFELPHGVDMINGYGQPPYVLPELESYEAVPHAPQPLVPFTPVAYSVDAIRSSLLAQLEYYLSPQNMAQDLFLRQRMDDEGWIPISLLASFKRVQQFHADGEVVREVLSQSVLVEVSGNWVRMGERQWELFVLPNASRSVVTGVSRGQGHSLMPRAYHDGDAYAELDEMEDEHGEIEGDGDGEDCEADEEEDDIEFVIGEEAEGSWMPVQERKP